MPQVISTQEGNELEALGLKMYFSVEDNMKHCQLLGENKTFTGRSDLERRAYEQAITAARAELSPKPADSRTQAEKIADLEHKLEELKPAPTRRRKRAKATTNPEPDRALDTGDAAQDTSEE